MSRPDRTSVELSLLTPGNWREFVALRVGESQRGYVDENVLALAETAVHEELAAYGAYAGGEPVGMLVFGESEPGVGMIHHVMLAEEHQGRGLGREVLRAALELARERDLGRVVLSYVPGNPAARLYESLGFRHTGKKWGEEPVMALDLRGEAPD